jgi:hypothetical protein
MQNKYLLTALTFKIGLQQLLGMGKCIERYKNEVES